MTQQIPEASVDPTRSLERSRVSRGKLQVYLGATPGSGKTSAMLAEAHRQLEAGRSVMVGIIETHGRAIPESLLDGLPRLSSRHVAYRGSTFEELDVDGIEAARPAVVVVDELAHRCVPGSRHVKRWQDVAELLDAGIDVITALNVQHLESLADEVEATTGVHQQETVPDVLVGNADRIEFLESAPDAVAGSFSSQNLATLRELGHTWLRSRGLNHAPESHAGVRVPERVVVALTGAPEAEHVLRRAATLADASGGDLIGVYVRVPSDTVEVEPIWLDGQRRLLLELGGNYEELAGVDVAATVIDFAQKEEARQLVLGSTRRTRREELLHGSVITKAIRSAGPMEVHVIPPLISTFHPPFQHERPTRHRPVMLPRQRRAAAWVLALGLPWVVSAALIPARSSLGLAGVLLCNLLAVVCVALLGGFGPALLATGIAFVAADLFYAPPFYSLRVARWVDLVALITFVVIAGIVGWLVDRQARQGVRVASAVAQTDNLVDLAAECLTMHEQMETKLTAVRRALDLDGLTLLRRGDDGGWMVEAASGQPVFQAPDEAPCTVEVGNGLVLAMVGSALESPAPTLQRSFVERLRYIREREQLR